MKPIVTTLLQTGQHIVTDIAIAVIKSKCHKCLSMYHTFFGSGSAYDMKKELALKRVLRCISKYDSSINSFIEHLFNTNLHTFGDIEDNKEYRIGLNVVVIRKKHDPEVNCLKITFDIYGPNASSILALFEKYIESVPDPIGYDIEHLRNDISRQFYKKFGRMPKFSDLIGKAPKKLHDNVKQFLDNKETYDKYGLLYKYNVLLEGPPGTGKSSMILAVAQEFNLPIFVIDANTDLKSALRSQVDSGKSQYTKRPFLCIIEEVDLLLCKDEIDSYTGNRYTKDEYINALMQFLDGMNTNEYCISIITTNNVNQIDPRLMRAGRIDLRIHCGFLTRRESYAFKEKFSLTNEEFEYVLSQADVEDNECYSPAKLENLIMNYIKDNKIKE